MSYRANSSSQNERTTGSVTCRSTHARYRSSASIRVIANGSATGLLAVDASGDLTLSSSGSDVSIGNGVTGADGTGAVAIGAFATRSSAGTAIGYNATGVAEGVALGQSANGDGVAIGANANGSDDNEDGGSGVAVGFFANGTYHGVAVGHDTNGSSDGVAVGHDTNGSSDGVAVGYSANGSGSGVAIGEFSDAQGISNIALGGNNSSSGNASVNSSWTDTTEIGRGAASLRGGLNFRGYGIVSAGGSMVAPVMVSTTTASYFTGNLGIGTTSPASSLTVVGSTCISSGAGATAPCSTAAGTITANVFNTANADLAETYSTPDPSLVAGDIVAVGPTADASVVRATIGASVIGVVSTQPGVLLGGTKATSSVPVALAGRVPVAVSMENGPISRGDALALSSTPGVAMRAGTSPNPRVGVALGAAATDGTVLAFLRPGFVGELVPQQAITDLSGPGSTLAAAAASLTDWVGQRVVAVEGLFHHVRTDTLDAQRVTSHEGFQTTDAATGQTYCIRVANGVLTTLLGTCDGPAAAGPSGVSTASGTDGGGATSTAIEASTTPAAAPPASLAPPVQTAPATASTATAQATDTPAS